MLTQIIAGSLDTCQRMGTKAMGREIGVAAEGAIMVDSVGEQDWMVESGLGLESGLDFGLDLEWGLGLGSKVALKELKVGLMVVY